MKKILSRMIIMVISFTVMELHELKAAANTTQSAARTRRQRLISRRQAIINRQRQSAARRTGQPTSRRVNRSTPSRQQSIAQQPLQQPMIQQPSVPTQQLKTVNQEAYKNPETQPTAPIEQTQNEKKAYPIYQTTGELLAAAQKLLSSPREERTWKGDLYSGYTEQQRINALIQLAALKPIFLQVYDSIKRKKRELIPLKGFNIISVEPGKEKEYAALSLEITKLTDMLEIIKKAMYDQSIIAGQDWSKTYYALLFFAGATPPGWMALGAKKSYDYLTSTPEKNKQNNPPQPEEPNK